MSDTEGSPKTQETKLEWFKEIVKLFRAFAWPITIFILVVLFWAPIRQGLDSLSDMVPNASEVEVAGVKFDFNAVNTSGIKTTPEVTNALSKLSPAAFARFMEDGGSDRISMQDSEIDSDLRESLNELKNAGLETNTTHNGVFDATTTKLGHTAYHDLIASLASAVQPK
jgi:hypothetical protein